MDKVSRESISHRIIPVTRLNTITHQVETVKEALDWREHSEATAWHGAWRRWSRLPGGHEYLQRSKVKTTKLERSACSHQSCLRSATIVRRVLPRRATSGPGSITNGR